MSVIVPVGGVDAALFEQVSALRAQVCDQSFEVILACNSPETESLDTLVDVARKAGPLWRAVDASARRGPAFARNYGADAAEGDQLLFCDADDIVAPRWVEAMVASLWDNDAVTGPLPPFGPAKALATKPPGRQDGLPLYMGVPYLPSGNLGIRRAAFEAVGGFDERLRTSEDIALAWSLQVRGCRIAWAPGAIVRRRYRDGAWAMTRQHFRYGRGISRVLLWYGIPGNGQWDRPGWRLLRPNSGARDEAASTGSSRSTVVRGALAFGRLVGIAEGVRRRSSASSDGDVG